MSRQNIISINHSSMNQLRIKAVHGRSAQIAILCGQVTDRLHRLHAFNSINLDKLTERTDVVLCVALQAFYSLRISEVLSINCSNIDSSGRVYIQCKKGSQQIVINDLQLSEIFLYYKQQNINPFRELDRFYVYRIYKSAGIRCSSSGRFNNSVTHAFRHINAKEVRGFSNNNKYVSTLLHHTSGKSQEHYGKK